MNSTTRAGRPFHRYEYLENGEWHGIFGMFDPSERRFVNKYLKAPGWYQENPGMESQAWFTDRGFRRYEKLMEKTIRMHKETYGSLPEIRIREAMELTGVVSHGAVQCIVALESTADHAS